MGFLDEATNLEVLRAANGNAAIAIE